MRHAKETIEDVAERRNAVQIVKDDNSGHWTGSDVIGDVGALVSDVVEVLTQFAARLAVDLEHGYQLLRWGSPNVVWPTTN